MIIALFFRMNLTKVHCNHQYKKASMDIKATVCIAVLLTTTFTFFLNDLFDSLLPELSKGIQDTHHNSNHESLSHLPHHMLLLDESIQERIKNTNSSDYTWVGNHWLPPPGVPTFTPRQLKAYYSQRNVLVIGDSTKQWLCG